MKVKVSPKYQVVIPMLVRRILGLKAGSLVDVVVKGRVAFIVPVNTLSAVQSALEGRLSIKNIRDKKDRL
ncbi:MAG TPA: AbrB/MazE/SpoVT family DNA-binding domain-containing protein [Bdellovibrionota bacterium]|nr:AbrB/MazE/SpoVT family DNA-binding domain-containing protein [Bdellovibrionota bacterium]